MGNTSLKGSAISRWQARHNLKAAISSRDDAELKKLLTVHGSGCQGVRVNKAGDTLLMLAVREQHPQAVGLLLSYNAANPNLTNHSGSTALDVALLGSACPVFDMDDLVTLLARITCHVSTNVLTSVLDTEDTARAARTAALVARHSPQYEVRAKLLYTMLQYYPYLLEPVLVEEGADPTGLTDARLDTRRLWSETASLHYFRKPILQLMPRETLILLLRAANSQAAIAMLADLVMAHLENADPASTKDDHFFSQALRLLSLSGYLFSPAQHKLIEACVPDVGSWCQTLERDVPSLSALTRNTIRSATTCNVVYGARQLPLPACLQRYVCLA